MRYLSDTVARLSAFNRPAIGAPIQQRASRLGDLGQFGPNPGCLGAKFYVPPGLPPGAPLVVVLHGCTQDPATFDNCSGWSQVADEGQFALLYPEQQRSNNPNLCFNWFSPTHIRRQGGEAESILKMIDAFTARYGLDPNRTFVTGLSAGGAMAMVMLATYPERFAGGATCAGLPYGAASTMPEAFDRMRGHGLPDAAALTQYVRKASSHRGPWPKLSIWQGSGDQTVSPSNAEAIIEQWRGLHAASPSPNPGMIDGCVRRSWVDVNGREVIEAMIVPGMAHGLALNTVGPGSCGASGPYMIDVGVSSTRHTAGFWGIAPETVADGRRRMPAAASPSMLTAHVSDRPLLHPTAPAALAGGRIGEIIENALRSAGLMK
ncbi:extracellular catalytic domain type 1 short-chain-length polyhydroxyalkanoate depolymerase [Chelatococcus reniformis]|uniref:extracellular catalytic domain type 1 short-chain-length polyhydroxyalkanoate depolymerase n=1 Tax=Chelatococcus reniformis TaxID=1494448 RepID=UPI00166674E2|nr:PHB depolymerase family esterase [Chelatococcus reniformis]